MLCSLAFCIAKTNRGRRCILLSQDTWAQKPCQKDPGPSCVCMAEAGERSKALFLLEPPRPLRFAERLQALSPVLVIPFLNCCSQVIVSSCCTEIFSHRVTITFISQTKAPLFTYRKPIPKHLWLLCPGEEGKGQVRLGGVLVVWRLRFLSLSFTGTSSELLTAALMSCCCNALAKARYL